MTGADVWKGTKLVIGWTAYILAYILAAIGLVILLWIGPIGWAVIFLCWLSDWMSERKEEKERRHQDILKAEAGAKQPLNLTTQADRHGPPKSIWEF